MEGSVLLPMKNTLSIFKCILVLCSLTLLSCAIFEQEQLFYKWVIIQYVFLPPELMCSTKPWQLKIT